MISLKDKLLQNGIIKVENVFSKGEITNIQQNLQKYFENRWTESDCGKVQTNASVNCDFLEDVLTHPNIISTMKAVADGTPLFTGNADIHQNRSSTWHKDTVFFDSDPFNENYKPVYKVGIYLQDQLSKRGGIQYREGSHNINNCVDGLHKAITTRAGDIFIFDLRTTHSGMLSTLPEKIVWRINRLLSTEKKKSSFGRRTKSLMWKMSQMKTRESIFFVFGSDNDYTDEFARNIVKAQSSDPEHNAKISTQLSQNLQKRGIKVCHYVNPSTES